VPESQESSLSANINRLRKGLGRYRLLLTVIVLVALSLAYSSVFHHRLSQLVETSLPNAIAALFVFLALYILYAFIGISPSDEIAQLLDNQRDKLKSESQHDLRRIAGEIQRLQLARPRGIRDLYPHWDEMSGQDWEVILDEARHVDIVMNWCDSLLEGNARAFRRLISSGMTIALYLPDPGGFGDSERLAPQDRTRLNQLGAEYALPRGTVRLHIAESAVKLVELGAREDQITIRLLKRLTYSAVRIDRSRLLISHYDQFRMGHPRAHALLLDLDESAELQSYWADQFYRYESIQPTPLEKMLRLRRSFGAPAPSDLP
jgi:hypothetical protein